MAALIRRRLGVIILAAVVLVLLSANRIATLVTDYWWYDNLGYAQVFTGKLSAQVLLFVVFGVLLAVMVGASLQWTRRIRPLFIPATAQEMALEQYRQRADPFLKWIILAVAVLFGVSAGGTAATQWETFLLWRNGGSFGITDPQFGTDVGFYIFDLPWLSFVQGWLFTSLILVLVITVAAHVMLGGIRPDNEGEKMTQPVKVHLSVLVVLILAVRAVGWWLDRYNLNFSPRGTVTGASFTDVNAELPALYLLIALTVVAIGLVLYSIRRPGFLMAGAGIALLVVASLVLQSAYPAFIQRVRVEPQELEKEAEYIARNIEATNRAYGIDGAALRPFDVNNDLSEADLTAEAPTLTNVRLWDPETLRDTYEALQDQRPYYTFHEVDVDRYEIDGELRQVMLATRELEIAGLSENARSWQNEKLVFTHGRGVVASRVNTATTSGQPVFLSRDIPTRGAQELIPGDGSDDDAGAIYYGERDNPVYSIVNTDQPELAFETGDEQVTTQYEGDGGVELGGPLRRLMFLSRFSDPNFLLSGLLNDESRVMFNRNVRERVSAIAPYLSLDADPYPVVLDGRVVWVQDAYTTSANYPYSERTTTQSGEINYIRNSVKAVVDAYHGSVTLYVVDPEDPIIQAWQRAFPDPYAPLSDAPAQLEKHFRYPQDLFTLQARMYRTYHILDTEAFYNKADEWAIPNDAAGAQNRTDGLVAPLDPYYLLMKLPGEVDEEFVLIQPYLPRGKEIMNAWLAGRSDPEHYGELVAYQFPVDADVLGPGLAQARIEQEAEISQYITLLSDAGSEVIRGNMQIIPIGDSILYVEPLFIDSDQASIPELDKVVVVLGDRVVMEDTLDLALRRVVGARLPVEGEDDGEELSEEPAELITQAILVFAEADQALRDGNLALYQQRINRARQLLERAAELLDVDVEELLEPEEPEPTESGTDAPASGDGQDGTEPEPSDTQTAAAP